MSAKRLIGGPLDGESIDTEARYIEALDPETFAIVRYECIGDSAQYIGRAPRPDFSA